MRSKKKIVTAPLNEQDVVTAVDKMSDITDFVAETLQDRREQAVALSYAVACGEHLLLDGSHGLAKSALTDLFFDCLGGNIKTFKEQLNTYTDPETIVGPFDLNAYQNRTVFRYNTNGYLPEAHFGYLDELYRATGRLLSMMLGILNERSFKNEGVIRKCPLVTAIGTTNFVSLEDDMQAFNDRWLFRCKVNAVADSDVAEMLRKHSAGRATPPTPLKLRDVRALHFGLSNLDFHPTFFSMFADYLRRFSITFPQYALSDRRKCKALNLFKAVYLSELISHDQLDSDKLDFGDDLFTIKPYHELSLAALRDVQYALMVVGDPSENSQYETMWSDFYREMERTQVIEKVEPTN